MKVNKVCNSNSSSSSNSSITEAADKVRNEYSLLSHRVAVGYSGHRTVLAEQKTLEMNKCVTDGSLLYQRYDDDDDDGDAAHWLWSPMRTGQ
ncbi:hypothetical protein M0804_011380 [Polistes exclamans]|nr:hypothetical protein M0804_011380 [Polistes exclamans]